VFLSGFENIGKLLKHSFNATIYHFESGLQLTYNFMQRQAMMLSFSDVFFLLCLLNLAIVPLTFLLNRTIERK